MAWIIKKIHNKSVKQRGCHAFVVLLLAGSIFCSALGCAPFPDIEATSHEAPFSTESESLGASDEAAEAEAEWPDVPTPETLVINEIYYDAPDSDTDGVLFVELFGTASTAIGGYQIHLVNGANGAITDVLELPADAMIRDTGLFVIADGRTGALQTTQVADYDYIDNFDPQNGPDGVQLLNREGEVIDSVIYGEGVVMLSEDGLLLGEGEAAVDVSSGHSLTRHTLGGDTDDNATDFVENLAPSPGSE